jgi:GNAT superfamily N-acetyltransferase
MPLVEKFIAPEFSPEGQRNLLSSMTPEAIESLFRAGHCYHVAEMDGRLAGVIGVRGNSHVHHLFVAEDFQLQGVAGQLWSVAKQACLEAGNPGRFSVCSSRIALEVYKSLGFSEAGPPETKDSVTAFPMRWEDSTI